MISISISIFSKMTISISISIFFKSVNILNRTNLAGLSIQLADFKVLLHGRTFSSADRTLRFYFMARLSIQMAELSGFTS